MKHFRAMTCCLRALAVLQILTGVIAVAPTGWIANWHAWLRVGPMTHDPVLLYAIRGGGFVQAAIGVLIWIMSTDALRYRPLIIAVGTIYLVAGPAFYVIDWVTAMPPFWCAIDAVSCFLVGAVLLALSRPLRARETSAIS